MRSFSAPDWLDLPLPLQMKLVTPAGSRSLTCTLVAVLGPLLLTTMVYVVVVPGTTEVTPSSLVTPTSHCGVNIGGASGRVLVLLLSLAAVTVTVLVIELVAEVLICATTV